jgi:hypothetical protein
VLLITVHPSDPATARRLGEKPVRGAPAKLWRSLGATHDALAASRTTFPAVLSSKKRNRF